MEENNVANYPAELKQKLLELDADYEIGDLTKQGWERKRKKILEDYFSKAGVSGSGNFGGNVGSGGSGSVESGKSPEFGVGGESSGSLIASTSSTPTPPIFGKNEPNPLTNNNGFNQQENGRNMPPAGVVRKNILSQPRFRSGESNNTTNNPEDETFSAYTETPSEEVGKPVNVIINNNTNLNNNMNINSPSIGNYSESTNNSSHNSDNLFPAQSSNKNAIISSLKKVNSQTISGSAGAGVSKPVMLARSSKSYSSSTSNTVINSMPNANVGTLSSGVSVVNNVVPSLIIPKLNASNETVISRTVSNSSAESNHHGGMASSNATQIRKNMMMSSPKSPLSVNSENNSMIENSVNLNNVPNNVSNSNHVVNNNSINSNFNNNNNLSINNSINNSTNSNYNNNNIFNNNGNNSGNISRSMSPSNRIKSTGPVKMPNPLPSPLSAPERDFFGTGTAKNISMSAEINPNFIPSSAALAMAEPFFHVDTLPPQAKSSPNPNLLHAYNNDSVSSFKNNHLRSEGDEEASDTDKFSTLIIKNSHGHKQPDFMNSAASSSHRVPPEISDNDHMGGRGIDWQSCLVQGQSISFNNASDQPELFMDDSANIANGPNTGNPTSLLSFSTIAMVLRYRAHSTPKANVISLLDVKGKDFAQSITFEKLNGRAEKISNLIKEKKSFHPGDIALLVYRTHEIVEIAAAVFGCFYAGIVPSILLVPPAVDEIQHLIYCVHNLGAKLVLTTDVNYKLLCKDISLTKRPEWPESVPIWKTQDLGVYQSKKKGLEELIHCNPSQTAFIEVSKSLIGEIKSLPISHKVLMNQLCIWKWMSRANYRDLVISVCECRTGFGLLTTLFGSIYCGYHVLYLNPFSHSSSTNTIAALSQGIATNGTPGSGGIISFEGNSTAGLFTSLMTAAAKHKATIVTMEYALFSVLVQDNLLNSSVFSSFFFEGNKSATVAGSKDLIKKIFGTSIAATVESANVSSSSSGDGAGGPDILLSQLRYFCVATWMSRPNGEMLQSFGDFLHVIGRAKSRDKIVSSILLAPEVGAGAIIAGRRAATPSLPPSSASSKTPPPNRNQFKKSNSNFKPLNNNSNNNFRNIDDDDNPDNNNINNNSGNFLVYREFEPVAYRRHYMRLISSPASGYYPNNHNRVVIKGFSIGRLVPNVSCMLVDSDTGQFIMPGSGKIGELWIQQAGSVKEGPDNNNNSSSSNSNNGSNSFNLLGRGYINLIAQSKYFFEAIPRNERGISINVNNTSNNMNNMNNNVSFNNSNFNNSNMSNGNFYFIRTGILAWIDPETNQLFMCGQLYDQVRFLPLPEKRQITNNNSGNTGNNHPPIGDANAPPSLIRHVYYYYGSEINEHVALLFGREFAASCLFSIYINDLELSILVVESGYSSGPTSTSSYSSGMLLGNSSNSVTSSEDVLRLKKASHLLYGSLAASTNNLGNISNYFGLALYLLVVVPFGRLAKRKDNRAVDADLVRKVFELGLLYPLYLVSDFSRCFPGNGRDVLSPIRRRIRRHDILSLQGQGQGQVKGGDRGVLSNKLPPALSFLGGSLMLSSSGRNNFYDSIEHISQLLIKRAISSENVPMSDDLLSFVLMDSRGKQVKKMGIGQLVQKVASTISYFESNTCTKLLGGGKEPLQPGDIVIIYMSWALDLTVALHACLYYGLVPILMCPIPGDGSGPYASFSGSSFGGSSGVAGAGSSINNLDNSSSSSGVSGLLLDHVSMLIQLIQKFGRVRAILVNAGGEEILKSRGVNAILKKYKTGISRNGQPGVQGQAFNGTLPPVLSIKTASHYNTSSKSLIADFLNERNIRNSPQVLNMNFHGSTSDSSDNRKGGVRVKHSRLAFIKVNIDSSDGGFQLIEISHGHLLAQARLLNELISCTSSSSARANNTGSINSHRRSSSMGNVFGSGGGGGGGAGSSYYFSSSSNSNSVVANNSHLLSSIHPLGSESLGLLFVLLQGLYSGKSTLIYPTREYYSNSGTFFELIDKYRVNQIHLTDEMLRYALLSLRMDSQSFNLNHVEVMMVHVRDRVEASTLQECISLFLANQLRAGAVQTCLSHPLNPFLTLGKWPPLEYETLSVKVIEPLDLSLDKSNTSSSNNEDAPTNTNNVNAKNHLNNANANNVNGFNQDLIYFITDHRAINEAYGRGFSTIAEVGHISGGNNGGIAILPYNINHLLDHENSAVSGSGGSGSQFAAAGGGLSKIILSEGKIGQIWCNLSDDCTSFYHPLDNQMMINNSNSNSNSTFFKGKNNSVSLSPNGLILSVPVITRDNVLMKPQYWFKTNYIGFMKGKSLNVNNNNNNVNSNVNNSYLSLDPWRTSIFITGKREDVIIRTTAINPTSSNANGPIFRDIVYYAGDIERVIEACHPAIAKGSVIVFQEGMVASTSQLNNLFIQYERSRLNNNVNVNGPSIINNNVPSPSSNNRIVAMVDLLDPEELYNALPAILNGVLEHLYLLLDVLVFFSSPNALVNVSVGLASLTTSINPSNSSSNNNNNPTNSNNTSIPNNPNANNMIALASSTTMPCLFPLAYPPTTSISMPLLYAFPDLLVSLLSPHCQITASSTISTISTINPSSSSDSGGAAAAAVAVSSAASNFNITFSNLSASSFVNVKEGIAIGAVCKLRNLAKSYWQGGRIANALHIFFTSSSNASGSANSK